MGTERNVNLPDGRSVIGLWAAGAPAAGVHDPVSVDFQMLAYDHRGAPRDYQSIIRVVPVRANFETFDHVTKLNSPLRAPFEWDDNKSWFTQIIPKLASGMDPNQFKFSQAGWDQQGWAKTYRHRLTRACSKLAAPSRILRSWASGTAPASTCSRPGACSWGLGFRGRFM